MTTGIIRSALATSVVCVLAVATAAAQQRSSGQRMQPAQTPASLGVHGFSVVLVIGGTQGASSSASDNVPEAARKALADMKDFLPYKRYQLLDAAWILCCAPDTTQVSGRVRGPDGRDYLYTVDPGAITGSKLNLRFNLREIREVPVSSANVDKLSDTARLEYLKHQSEAVRELEEAELQVRTIRPRVEVGTAMPSELESATIRLRSAQQRVRDLERIGGGSAQGRGSASTNSTARASSGGRGSTSYGRELMDSSFLISPGETVVIGTSRINGDQALIAILTAATKPAAAAK